MRLLGILATLFVVLYVHSQSEFPQTLGRCTLVQKMELVAMPY